MCDDESTIAPEPSKVIYSVEEADRLFLKPFGLSLPKKATSPIICLEFAVANGGRFVSCPFFCALRNAEGQVVHCYKQEEAPKNYELHCYSHLLPNVAKPDVQTVFTKDEGSLTQSSLLAVKPDVKPSMMIDPLYILNELKTKFKRLSAFTTQSCPTHKWIDDKPIPLDLVLRLMMAVKPVLAADPSLLELEPPIYVIGDIHGNYHDLMSFTEAFGLLKTASFVPATFLFLGDYVDRGRHGLETILWLFSMKIMYPKKVFLLRGNHEFSGVNMNVEVYGDDSFLHQLMEEYGSADAAIKIASAANLAFSELPFAAVVDKRIFCVHGGLPRDLVTQPDKDILELIRAIKRPIESEWPDMTLCFDLVWSDPANAEQERKLGIGYPPGFGPSPRGEQATVWGRSVMDDFFRRSGCTHIIRAHQAVMKGVEIQKSAQLFTLFSSSGYNVKNPAAAILIADGILKVIYVNNTGFF